LDLLTVKDDLGIGPCVIFRPKGVELADGAAYWVEIFGLEGTGPKADRGRRPGEPSLRYLVQFCAPVVRPPEDEDASSEDEPK